MEEKKSTFPITLHFDKINIINPFINYAIKRYLIQRIKQISPSETNNCWNSLKLLVTTENWKQLQLADSLESTENILSTVLSELLEKLRRRKTEDRFHRIRAWYIWFSRTFSITQTYNTFKSTTMLDQRLLSASTLL